MSDSESAGIFGNLWLFPGYLFARIFQKPSPPNLVAMKDLKEAVYAAVEECPGESKSFMPNNCFKKLITQGNFERVATIYPDEAFVDSIKVLATLLYIDELDAFQEIRKEGLTDKYLPVEYDKNLTALVHYEETEGGQRTGISFKPFPPSNTSAYKRFAKEQWVFRAPTFSGNDLGALHTDCPLPFLFRSKKIWRGGFGEVWQVQIHPSHLEISPTPVSATRTSFITSSR